MFQLSVARNDSATLNEKKSNRTNIKINLQYHVISFVPSVELPGV